MRLFTWYDVEVEFRKRRSWWPLWWNRVDVYNDEIVINIDPERNNKEENEETFIKIFGKFYMNGKVMVEFDQKQLDVIYEEGDESDRAEPIKTPLFKDMFTREETTKQEELAGSPLTVFHSYKGGVGRTLALISLVREISQAHGNQRKVLIVDADLEAPGLTWMLGQGKSNEKISYFDVLELLHFNSLNENFVDRVAGLVKTNVIKVMTYFVPPLFLLLMQNPQWIPEGYQFIMVKEVTNIPLLWQFLLLELAIDGLRLAAVNTPNMLSTPLSVMAALVLGEFSVNSGWFNSEVMLYMAFVAIASYTQQNYELSYAIKFMRIINLILTQIFGLYGFIGAVVFFAIAIVSNRTVSGKSYVYPLIPFNPKQLMRRLVRCRLPYSGKE